ncbi:MAG: hypothetical protein WCD33_07180 [Mycobacterium sp.]|uniref:hypothetical protein n=1 Tax=Mycobacterium sp. TaxID=1785 RepID=UPI003C790F09
MTVLKREEDLGWLLAATAVDPTPIDSEVQDMAINRIIDSVALAIAGVTADPVVRAQAQALAHPPSCSRHTRRTAAMSRISESITSVSRMRGALHLVGLWHRKPDQVEPRGYAVQQVWSALDPKVSESAKMV